MKISLARSASLFLSMLIWHAGVSQPCNAQEVVKLWSGEPAGPLSMPNGPEVDTQKPSDQLVGGKTVMKLGNVSTPEIHIYRATENDTGASCVICPGGGFHILAWDLEGVEVAQWLNSIGITAVILKYRVPTAAHEGQARIDGPVNDTQRAISYVRSKADDWKIDRNKVGVLGFSAGGITAAAAAMQNGERNYSASDAIDENSCRADWAVLVYPAYLADSDGKLRSEYSVTDQTPPMFMVHAQDDPVTCQSSVALFTALRDAKVPADLHIFANGGHGYGLRPSKFAVTKWPTLAEAWLQTIEVLPASSSTSSAE